MKDSRSKLREMTQTSQRNSRRRENWR